MARISIALCTYNGEPYIQQQLDSFAAQDRLPDELVVCDDRSTDDTVAIVERFATTARFPVRLSVNDTNLGSTQNFEKAIGMCEGDLIFLSDQDDVWMPGKLRLIEREFETAENVGLIFSDAEIVDEDLRPTGQRLSDLTFHSNVRSDLAKGDAFNSLLNQNFVTGATTAFRANLRADIPPTPESVPNLIHDGWIALSIAARAEIRFIDEPLIKYRQHGSQQVGLRTGREEDRREFFGKTIRTLESEIERLRRLRELMPDSADVIDRLILEKSAYRDHCDVRMKLSRSRVGRIGPIARELASGNYGRFSRGVGSAVKDLFEARG